MKKINDEPAGKNRSGSRCSACGRARFDHRRKCFLSAERNEAAISKLDKDSGRCRLQRHSLPHGHRRQRNHRRGRWPNSKRTAAMSKSMFSVSISSSPTLRKLTRPIPRYPKASNRKSLIQGINDMLATGKRPEAGFDEQRDGTHYLSLLASASERATLPSLPRIEPFDAGRAARGAEQRQHVHKRSSLCATRIYS